MEGLLPFALDWPLEPGFFFHIIRRSNVLAGDTKFFVLKVLAQLLEIRSLCLRHRLVFGEFNETVEHWVEVSQNVDGDHIVNRDVQINEFCFYVTNRRRKLGDRFMILLMGRQQTFDGVPF